ncbi:hypothetical protein ACHWQZ_G013235 [Mnemiopsis leidyi]
MNKNPKVSETPQNDPESACIAIRSVPAKPGPPTMSGRGPRKRTHPSQTRPRSIRDPASTPGTANQRHQNGPTSREGGPGRSAWPTPTRRGPQERPRAPLAPGMNRMNKNAMNENPEVPETPQNDSESARIAIRSVPAKFGPSKMSGRGPPGWTHPSQTRPRSIRDSASTLGTANQRHQNGSTSCQRCVVKFTERLTGMEVTQTCPNRSLYTMSRRSQEVYDHEIERGSVSDGIRFHGGVDKRRHTGRVNGRLYSKVVETRLHISGMVDGCQNNFSTIFQNIDGNKTNFDAFSLEMERVAGILYRPPSGDSTEALNELRKIIEWCPKKNVYLLGDFNINMHDKSNKLVNDFENIIFGLGLTPLISTFTHHKPGCNKTCIDNILTNSSEKVIQSGTMSTCISHHHAIFSIFKSPIITENNQSGQKHFQYYDYNNKNVNKFVNELEFKLISEPPDSFSEFFSAFNEQLDKACKLERPKCSKRTAKNNPWITQGLITSIDSKHELYNNWKKAEKQKCLSPNLQTDNRGRCSTCSSCTSEVACHKEFTVYRRSLNHLINSAKRKYHGEKIAECAGNSKKTWQIINNLRGKKTRVIKPNFIIDNERVTNRRVIANEFNKYFASLASNLNEVYSGDYLRINPMPSFTDYLPTSISSSIYLRECDCQEIIEIISELKNGKSSDIPIHVIKKSSHIITPYLVKYFNRCMQDGYFPCELKTGRISPIYKKEDEQLLENYRPVSTLPVFGKIFEKIIYSRLYSFLISKGVINENQFGFRKGHSTSNALNYSVEHIESLLAKKQHVLGIFIDLSKAFDTIDHRKLTTKLEHYGIRGNALQLISSYLSNRKQYVNVLDIKSDELPVQYGVPQGSVLGPLLFILYINDICNISTDAKLVLFADDTNIFVAAESISKVYEIANKVLKAVCDYMEVNLLHINVKKCCYMYFSPNKRIKNDTNADHDDHYLSINSKIISRVSCTKFLGVTIDDKLNWRAHIQSLNMKLRSTCGRIYRIKQCLPESLYKQIYHSLFESHLGYAISVWGGISSNQIKPLFVTQKKCVRILFGDSEKYLEKSRTCARIRPINRQKLGSEFYEKESTKPLFTKHELLAVENLYRHRCIMEMFKTIKSHVPVSLFSLFKLSTRKDNLLITPRPTEQFIYKSSWLWNEFRSTSTLNFSSRLSVVKNSVRNVIFSAQSKYGSEWNELNFTKF